MLAWGKYLIQQQNDDKNKNRSNDGNTLISIFYKKQMSKSYKTAEKNITINN